MTYFVNKSGFFRLLRKPLPEIEAGSGNTRLRNIFFPAPIKVDPPADKELL